MKASDTRRRRGFTLLETVIAIGVLAVLLTGFLVVFTPAADGIRKSINTEHADRLASALEQELVNVRPGQTSTTITNGFSKAFEWIKNSNNATEALLVYQYRGKISNFRNDGTPEHEPSLADKLPGRDYIVVPMVRRPIDEEDPDEKLSKDLEAIEGAVYVVKCTQLIYDGTRLIKGTPGNIADPKYGTSITSTDDYLNPPSPPDPNKPRAPASTIAFVAEFHMTPIRPASYFSGPTFTTDFTKLRNPVFTRHLSIRR
jgi:prepilin-type N-terminal cleavage/methylation domain-containing protein